MKKFCSVKMKLFVIVEYVRKYSPKTDATNPSLDFTSAGSFSFLFALVAPPNFMSCGNEED